MKLFKKRKINKDLLFQEQYQSINKIYRQYQEEFDYTIKQSLLELLLEKYDELIKLIDEGVSQDKNHFINLRNHIKEELETVKKINEDI